MLIEWIKAYLVPGSATFLLLVMSAGVLMLYMSKRIARWGRILLTFLLLSYWLMAAPFFANALETLLQNGYVPLDTSGLTQPVDAIVILGGGSVTQSIGAEEINTLSDSSALRVLEALRLYEQLDGALVIVSCGINERVGRMTPESYPMREALLAAGVPADQILMESGSRDTYEQALYLKPILAEENIDTFILVTSETHMRRSLAVFQAQGMEPIPSAVSQHSEGQTLSRWGIFPDEEALDASRHAMREFMSLVYYGISGRLTP